MQAEISPEPTPEEREALTLALREADADGSVSTSSAWPRAGLDVDDDYEATARPRSSRGATRA